VYHAHTADGGKVTCVHPDAAFDWAVLVARAQAQIGAEIVVRQRGSHTVLKTADAVALADFLRADCPQIDIVGVGDVIEIYKETGLPAHVCESFGVAGMAGTHAIGHTRMATESAVTTAGSHPFSTGYDLCLVHNGSLSNHNRLREKLTAHEGVVFKTENDTEVGAAYIASRLQAGRSLHQALEDSLNDLDGFFTFVAGTGGGFAVLRDPIACKPAVLAETDDYVAFGSEFRALSSLPNIDSAKLWEPEPAVVYSWDVGNIGAGTG
jgi:amidophosphoribosyltransferase